MRVCLSLRDSSFSPSTHNRGDHPALPLCLYFCHFNLVPTWNRARHFYFSVLLSLQRKSLNSHSLLKPAFLAHWHEESTVLISSQFPEAVHLLSQHLTSPFLSVLAATVPAPVPCLKCWCHSAASRWASHCALWPRDPVSIIQGVVFSCSRTRSGSFPNRYFCRLANTYTTS